MPTKSGGSKQSRKEPVHTIGPFYTGNSSIDVAIWENTVGEDNDERQVYGVSIKRSYRAGDEWKSTKTLRGQDLPHVMLGLQQAYFWIQEQTSRQ